MTFRLTIDTDNAAFANMTGHEIGRILTELAESLDELGGRALRKQGDGKLYDLNGNCVGRWTVAEPEPPAPTPLLTSARTRP